MLIFVSAIEVQKKSFLRYFCRKLSSVDWSGTNLCGWMQKEENKDFPRSKSSKWFKFKNNISLRLKLSQRGKWDPRHIFFSMKNVKILGKFSANIFFIFFRPLWKTSSSVTTPVRTTSSCRWIVIVFIIILNSSHHHQHLKLFITTIVHPDYKESSFFQLIFRLSSWVALKQMSSTWTSG